MKKNDLSKKNSIYYHDCIAFLSFLAFSVTWFSGGFQASFLLGVVTSLLVSFVFDFLLIIYIVLRKLVFLIADKCVNPLLDALRDYQEGLEHEK